MHLANRIAYRPVLGSRLGTAVAEYRKVVELLGVPHNFGTYRDYENGTGDSKVTVTWTVQTPRGLAELRDYWWNAETEWSIAAKSRKAAMYLARMLRSAGIPASTRFYDRSKCKPFINSTL